MNESIDLPSTNGQIDGEGKRGNFVASDFVRSCAYIRTDGFLRESASTRERKREKTAKACLPVSLRPPKDINWCYPSVAGKDGERTHPRARDTVHASMRISAHSQSHHIDDPFCQLVSPRY